MSFKIKNERRKKFTATTSIWSIKNHLDQSIKYIINPEKTTNKDFGNNYIKPLELSDYTEYDFKNEKVEYVTALNCLEYKPYEDMKDTKLRYGKTDGILGFHAYQSFKEGEVTADVAHEIGVKLAEEMWNDYEVVVATHQNTNHIHNHFIINSVSYKTGKKYNNNHTNLAKLRYISDSLCREYNLNTLNEDISYKKTFKNKILSSDYYQMLKEDVDTVISESFVMKQFYLKLKQLSYHVYNRYGVITVWKDGYDKVRLEQSFGENYSVDTLNKRFYNARYKKYSPLSNNDIYKSYLLKTNNHHKGIYGLYLYYCYLLKVFPSEQSKQYLPYSIRKDIKIMDRISKETRFMVNNNIETLEDLSNFRTSNNNELTILKSKRENLWKKYHRTKTDEDKQTIYQEIQELQPRIKELYQNNKYCNDIEKRSTTIQNNINEIDTLATLAKEKDNVRF